MLLRLIPLLLIFVICSSCNRLADNNVFKASYGDEVFQDNDSLYAKLDSNDEANLKYLKHLVDTAEIKMLTELAFVDSVDTDYSSKSIILGNRKILEIHYKDLTIEKEIYSILNRVDVEFQKIDSTYKTEDYKFLPIDSSTFYHQAPVNLLKVLFEMTISSLQKAERDVLSKRANNVKK